MKYKTPFFASIFLMGLPIFAQNAYDTANWLGNTREGTSGWGLSSVAENWSTGTIPDANTNVVFDNEYLTGKKFFQYIQQADSLAMIIPSQATMAVIK